MSKKNNFLTALTSYHGEAIGYIVRQRYCRRLLHPATNNVDTVVAEKSRDAPYYLDMHLLTHENPPKVVTPYQLYSALILLHYLFALNNLEKSFFD